MSEYKIECDIHGSRNAAFVCTHLFEGDRCGFNTGIDPDNPGNPTPDSWCDQCEAVLVEEGEWNKTSEAFASIKMVCESCYHFIRERNFLQNDVQFDAMSKQVSLALNDKQAILAESTGFGQHERFDWDRNTGELVFSHEGEPRLRCKIVFIGSHALSSGTWLWIWGNESASDIERTRLTPVRELGDARRFMKLSGATWTADEYDGWLMAAYATHILGGVGAYRTPYEYGHSYMVIMSTKRIQ